MSAATHIPDALLVSYSLFRDTSPTGAVERDDVPWSELVARIRNAPIYLGKAHCPLISLAQYGPTLSANGCIRHATNVERVFGGELDYDGEQMTPAEAAKLLQAAEILSVLYTSPSHRPDRPRWRLLLPFSEPTLPIKRAEYVGRANRILGGIASRESFTLSQSFFVGRVRGVQYDVFETIGRCIDLAAELEPQYHVDGLNSGESRFDATTDDELRASFERGENRYLAMLKLSSRWAARGMPADDIEANLLELLGNNSLNGDGIDLRTRCRPMAESATRKFGETRAKQNPREPTEPASSRIAIQLRAGDLHLYADSAEKLLTGELYERGQKLVRIGSAPELAHNFSATITRDTEQKVIVPVNAEHLRRRLNTVAEFQRFSRQRSQWEPADCPKDLASNILQVGDWKHFATLDGIATAPFLRPDLTLCVEPGYDRASRIFYVPNAPFPALPERVTKDDAAEALKRLIKPFEQFPFATGEAKAAFLSHLLAAAARHAIDTMPVMVYSAPNVATGKTLLSGMPARIAEGVEPAARPYTDDSEEIRKVLLSALLAGDREITFDNVANGAKVRSAVLCGFVTTPVYSDRMLGVSESPRLPNRCSVVLTGNNITPASDLARRCIVVRLDANAESARGRAFAIRDLKAYVRAHRPQLLVDALTVLVGYLQAGQPGGGRPLESFERWSRIARDPLLWLDQPDAVNSQELETEDEVAPLTEAFKELAKRPFAREFTAQGLAAACKEFAGEDLRNALQSAGCSDASAGAKVGYWLREHRDRVAGDWKLSQGRISHGRAVWTLQPVK